MDIAMEDAPGTRDPLKDRTEYTLDEAHTEAIADALLLGYAAAQIVRYPRAERPGTDAILPAALQVHAALCAQYGIGKVIGLRPSVGIAEAYGFQGDEVEDLMFYMVDMRPAA